MPIYCDDCRYLVDEKCTDEPAWKDKDGNDVCRFRDDAIDPKRYHQEPKRLFTIHDERIGFWLSAALDDPKTCDKMKIDIKRWFDSLAIPKRTGG